MNKWKYTYLIIIIKNHFWNSVVSHGRPIWKLNLTECRKVKIIQARFRNLVSDLWNVRRILGNSEWGEKMPQVLQGFGENYQESTLKPTSKKVKQLTHRWPWRLSSLVRIDIPECQSLPRWQPGAPHTPLPGSLVSSKIEDLRKRWCLDACFK